jgi:hypothetical protein
MRVFLFIFIRRCSGTPRASRRPALFNIFLFHFEKEKSKKVKEKEKYGREISVLVIPPSDFAYLYIHTSSGVLCIQKNKDDTHKRQTRARELYSPAARTPANKINAHRYLPGNTPVYQ